MNAQKCSYLVPLAQQHVLAQRAQICCNRLFLSSNSLEVSRLLQITPELLPFLIISGFVSFYELLDLEYFV